MANVSYPWNPFADNLNSVITKEYVKITGAKRVEIVPRAAPFFSTGLTIQPVSGGNALKLGEDYVLAHYFPEFVQKYNKNCYGSIVLLDQYTDIELYLTYATIGGPYVLDDKAFAETVVNLLNNPRITDWSNLVNVPTEFPLDPHAMPVNLTYDYYEFIDQFKNLVASLKDTGGQYSFEDLITVIEDHVTQKIYRAHIASPADIGLSNVENVGLATSSDLVGNSPNLLLSVATAKELITGIISGKFK